MPNQSQPILQVGPFFGIDASTSSYFLDAYHAQDSINVTPNRKFLGYLTARGRTANILSGQFLSVLRGVFQWQIAGQTDKYFGTSGSSLQYGSVGNGPTSITIPAQAAWVDTSFTTQQNFLFISDGKSGAVPIKVNTSFVATSWQFPPPTTALTSAAGAGGVLLGTYFYIVTFFNASQESSGGIVSQPVTVTNQAVNLSSIPTSSDPSVTGRNIYRFGGTQQSILLVGTINDNTTTTATDNVADLVITGQGLVQYRDPPQSFYDIVSFGGCIWGFGYSGTAVGEPSNISGSSDLWYSNYEEPYGFNSVNQVIPVGRNAGADIAVALRPLGSLLILLKFESIWLYFGASSPSTSAPPEQIANIGCASKRSAFVYQDVLYFVSPSQTIQMFNGAQLNNISDNRTQGAKSSIKAILDSFTLSDFEACVGFGYDQMACFSFPTQNLTFLYDISSGQWYKLSWAMTSGVFNSEEDQLVFGERVSAPGMLDQWFAAETDLGSSITSSYISRITDGGSPAAVKSFRYAVLLAPLQAGATATVTIIADPLGANIQTSQSISLQNFPNSHIISLPPIMTGSEVQVMISVTSTQKTEIQNVTVFGYVKRQFVSQG